MRVGDKVRVVGSESTYTYTRDGSEGIITEINDGGSYTKVRWSKLTGENGDINKEYDVNTAHLVVIEPAQQSQTGSNQLTLVYEGKSLSFGKNLVMHQSVGELLEKFCKAYNLIMPYVLTATTNLGVIYSQSAVISDMSHETRELTIEEVETASPLRRKQDDAKETIEEDGEIIYRNARTDAVNMAGVTRDELDAILEIIEAMQMVLEEKKDLIKSFADKINAL